MHDVLLWGLFFLVGMVYASVGHGGASGYLAVLSLITVMKPNAASTTALCLNLVVASIAWATYARAGHFRWRRALPFIAASVPMAFLGGMMRVGEKTYALLLAFALMAASLRLLLSHGVAKSGETKKPLSWPVALITGGAIGWLSGVVGVGGGIFLSPLLILCHWADFWATAAISACFIVVNSASGLLGRVFSHHAQALQIGSLLPLALMSGLGGMVGSWWGANKLSGLWLRRILAGVLLLASVKLTAKALA